MLQPKELLAHLSKQIPLVVYDNKVEHLATLNNDYNNESNHSQTIQILDHPVDFYCCLRFFVEHDGHIMKR